PPSPFALTLQPNPSFDTPPPTSAFENVIPTPHAAPTLPPRPPPTVLETAAAVSNPQPISPLLPPSLAPDSSTIRRPPPLAKEDPQRDLALLPMVTDLMSERPST
ncbi:MAG: hypothetical protein ACK559_02880, partial [bacterium]